MPYRVQNMLAKTESRSKLYDHENVIKNIKALAEKGYSFVGNLSPDFVPWSWLKLGVFLFVKDNLYYQYKLKPFLYDSTSDTDFDILNEPILGSPLSKIVTQDYIYMVYIQKKTATDKQPEILVLLRSDTSITGHHKLLGPYKDKEGDIVCGEIYFIEKKIFLINPKSGNFPTEPSKAVPILEKIWGKEGADAYFPGVEKDVIDKELLRRKKLIGYKEDLPEASDSKKPSVHPESASRTLASKTGKKKSSGILKYGSSLAPSQEPQGENVVDQALATSSKSAKELAQKPCQRRAKRSVSASASQSSPDLVLRPRRGRKRGTVVPVVSKSAIDLTQRQSEVHEEGPSPTPAPSPSRDLTQIPLEVHAYESLPAPARSLTVDLTQRSSETSIADPSVSAASSASAVSGNRFFDRRDDKASIPVVNACCVIL